MYSTTITRSGQMTLTRAARDYLGVKPGDRLNITFRDGHIVVERRMTEEEFQAQLRGILSPETKSKLARIIRRDRKKGIKTTHQMIEDYANSPEAKKELEEEYGPHPISRFA